MATVDEMRESLREIFDPEIPINIFDLGLIYKIEQPEEGKVDVEMTLTNPACPVGDQLTSKVREAIGKLNGVSSVNVKLVWEPPWNKEKMTFEGKLQFNMLGFE
ncbi:MAG: iron-sulfur cluster assembly protein [Planctomycetota bacterium]|nr:iron-sulfur cluster assembly protein [Planctomycetota bacterium]